MKTPQHSAEPGDYSCSRPGSQKTHSTQRLQLPRARVPENPQHPAITAAPGSGPRKPTAPSEYSCSGPGSQKNHSTQRLQLHRVRNQEKSTALGRARRLQLLWARNPENLQQNLRKPTAHRPFSKQRKSFPNQPPKENHHGQKEKECRRRRDWHRECLY